MGSEGDIQNPNHRPHAVCVPFPAQGHINPMLKLAKLLHHKGFHITFVNTEFNHRRLLKSRGLDSLDAVPTFRHETIPDGLPHSDAEATQDIPSLCESTKRTCLVPFQQLLAKLHGHNSVSSSSDAPSPPVTCIVSDWAMAFTLAASKELNIPNVLLFTASACGFMGYVHYHHLAEKGLLPVKNSSYLDTEIDWIPGMEGIPLKYLPNVIGSADPNDIMVNFVMAETEKARNASALVFNTFDDLEHEVLEALSSIYHTVFSIGPLQSLLDNVLNQHPPGSGSTADPMHRVGSSLWKEEPVCLEWLDTREQNSVVYVNFGSITVMTKYTFLEFVWGLANSNVCFLWVIRPDLVVGETATLPKEFVDETKDRGLLASWCPQEQVLNHPAVGGFLTHNGWNSTVESLCSGVPMISWPFFADQLTNCWFCETKWGVGMEITDPDRVEIEKKVRELMGDGSEKGVAMKKKAMEWKRSAEKAAAAPLGSSLSNLEKMITQVLLASPNNN